MRVLPFVDISAPRLPLEKSYSALIIFYLSTCSAASRNYPDFITAKRVDHDQNFSSAPHPNSDESSGSGSSRCIASGSKNTPSASANDTPCFLRLVAAFLGLNWKRMNQYMHNMHICQAEAAWRVKVMFLCLDVPLYERATPN